MESKRVEPATFATCVATRITLAPRRRDEMDELVGLVERRLAARPE
jgi:hypothetical protein